MTAPKQSLKSLTFTVLPKLEANPVQERRTKTSARLEEQKQFFANPTLMHLNRRGWIAVEMGSRRGQVSWRKEPAADTAMMPLSPKVATGEGAYKIDFRRINVPPPYTGSQSPTVSVLVISDSINFNSGFRRESKACLLYTHRMRNWTPIFQVVFSTRGLVKIACVLGVIVVLKSLSVYFDFDWATALASQ